MNLHDLVLQFQILTFNILDLFRKIRLLELILTLELLNMLLKFLILVLNLF